MCNDSLCDAFVELDNVTHQWNRTSLLNSSHEFWSRHRYRYAHRRLRASMHPLSLILEWIWGSTMIEISKTEQKYTYTFINLKNRVHVNISVCAFRVLISNLHRVVPGLWSIYSTVRHFKIFWWSQRFCVDLCFQRDF